MVITTDLGRNLIGQRLSHYTVLEEIHRGQFPPVYRARDEQSSREVALKVLPSELVRDLDRRARFLAEAQASATLEHPNIAVIHEVGETDGLLWIAMELPSGESLADRLERSPLPVEDALDVAIGVGSGLAYAHHHGVVHRDLHPENVLLTVAGRPKLVDFGLAKLLDVEQNPFLGQGEDESALVPRSAREVGGSAGGAFLSPEQARGGRADQRSDVFSFGLLLFKMLTGREPFEGASRSDILHAILREPTPRLFGLSGEARERLQPIVDRCLEKAPEKRYPSMAQVLEDLKRARLHLAAPRGMSLRAKLAVGLGTLAAVLALFVFLAPRSPEPTPTPQKPSLAVLPFENLSGDPELDWLRTGLPDMLVTDLAQSPELEVVGLDRLYPILDDVDHLDGKPLTDETVREIAQRAGVRSVLTGSFAKSGESIRLSARLEEPATGRELFSERVEASGEENIFRLVDQITEGLKTNLGVDLPANELDRDLKDVTTASVKAYREYAEGIRLHERYREEEAVPHFQRAIELDPEFAMALAKLGVVMSNLGLHDEADQYAERALEHVDRLSERERLYIEGWYYSRKPQTLDRAFDAYREAIERYPDHGSARHNLGNLLFSTERYEEAIDVLEELRSRGMVFPATYDQLSLAYRALGEVDEARTVLRDYAQRHPDDWTTVLSLAQLEIEAGDMERGLDALRQAETLGATPFRIAPIRWEADILQERWDDAEATAETLMETEGPVEKFLGGRLLALTALYRGEVTPVLAGIDRFVQGMEGNRSYRSQPLLFKARILFDLGRYEEARDVAIELTKGEATGEDRYGISQQALLLAAIGSKALGRAGEADRLVREYRKSLNPALGPAPVRLYHFAEGVLAKEDGDLETAISQLNEAESMLPPRGSDGVHTVIWYELASAHRLAGNDSEAIDWYERIAESTEERISEPIRFVRCFYYLGGLYDKDGDSEKARESYQRFVNYWGAGEIDRDLVARARARLR